MKEDVAKGGGGEDKRANELRREEEGWDLDEVVRETLTCVCSRPGQD